MIMQEPYGWLKYSGSWGLSEFWNLWSSWREFRTICCANVSGLIWVLRILQDYVVLYFGSSVYKIARLLVIAMISVHLFACAFYRVKKESADNPEDVDSFYESRNVLSTVCCIIVTLYTNWLNYLCRYCGRIFRKRMWVWFFFNSLCCLCRSNLISFSHPYPLTYISL